MSSGKEGDERNNENIIIKDVEFVQMLANPAYLSFLIQNNYLESTEFMQYLKKPPFIFMINFPNSLVFLDLLLQEDDQFKRELRKGEFIDYIHKQQYYQWLNNK